MNGLIGWLLQPAGTWISDPFAHVAEFFELFFGVGSYRHHN